MPKRGFVTVDNLILQYMNEETDIVDLILKEADETPESLLHLTPNQLRAFKAIGFLDPRNVKGLPVIAIPILVVSGILQIPLVPYAFTDDKLKQILLKEVEVGQPILKVDVNQIKNVYDNVRIPAIVLKIINGFAKVISKLKSKSERVYNFVSCVVVAGCTFLSNALLSLVGLRYDRTVIPLVKTYVRQHSKLLGGLGALVGRILNQIKRAVTVGIQLVTKAIQLVKQRLGLKTESLEILQEGIIDRIGSLILKPIFNFAKDFFGILAGMFADALDAIGLGGLMNKFPFSILKKYAGYGHQIMQKVEASAE